MHFHSCMFMNMCLELWSFFSPSLCAQSSPVLCDSMDYVAHQAPLSMRFPRQEYWLPFPAPGDCTDPGTEPTPPGSPILAGRFLPLSHLGKWKWKWKLLSHVQLFTTPWTVCSHGIFQVRILEWVAVPFSRESSHPRDQTQVSCFAGGFFTSWATREAPEPPGNPLK